VSRQEALKEYWRKVRAGEITPPKRNQKLTRKVRCDSTWAKGGEIILTVYPHGELGFRQLRCRAEYKLGLPEALRQAVILSINKLNARVKELKKNGASPASARRTARKELGL
jgi:hypothetical protein